jgi:hypothetical protein
MISPGASPDAIVSFARDLRELQQAAQQHKPVVDDILRSRSRDIRHVEHRLDGLPDLCGHEDVLRMHKSLCLHYWDLDSAATASYINAYGEDWDSEVEEGQT